MKKVMNMVKKRQKSSQSSGDDRSTGGGAASRLSFASGATSPILQCQRSGTSPSLKYNCFTDDGKDKSLSKLHVAVCKEDVDKVKKYVKKGFDQDSRSASAGSGSEKTPNKTQKLKRLLGKEDNLVNTRDRYARTPLHLCASNGNESILWQLLSHGADVHAKDCDGATPLHRAIDASHDDTARMILDRGCSLDVADVDGDTALHVAVRRQNNEVLAVLLRKGANPDLRNGLGDCPLHEAIKLELIPTAQLLLRGGSEVNVQGANGQTPLMIASANENMAVLVDTLLNYEADPFILNQEGKNALDYAANERIRDILIKFIDESRLRGAGEFSKSDNHSFDDDICEEDEVDRQQPQHQDDLTSWESSAVEDDFKESKLKHSPGMVDLSKFLTPSDDEIYATVENVRHEIQHVESNDEDDWDDDSLPLSNDKHPTFLPSAKEDPDQATSNDGKPAEFKKRWSSRKSRSLRSTHLHMMSRPLVRSEHNSRQGSSSSKSSLSDINVRQQRGGPKKPVEAMKHEFLNKLQRQNASVIKSSLSAGSVDDEDLLVPDMTILDPELLSMEKVDLLVHLQKVKLELDQIKAKSVQADEMSEEIRQLKAQLASKEIECKTWMTKIEQANDLADELESKMTEIQELNDNLEYERQKRKHLETMFQDANEQKQRQNQSQNETIALQKELEQVQNHAKQLEESIKQLEKEKQDKSILMSQEKVDIEAKTLSKIMSLESTISQLKDENRIVQAENVKLLEAQKREFQDLNQRLLQTTRDYEDLSRKHAHLLLSKKDLEVELAANINTTEVSDELSLMRLELKKLHEILAEKEKELVTVKLQETTSHDKMELMKSEVLHKEVRIHEVELKLDMEKRKIKAFEDHIAHLKTQLNELQMQAESAVSEKTATFQRIRDNLNKEDDVNHQWIKELKNQLRIEQDKLKQALDQVAVLEADKISCEIDLSNLTKKLSSANEDIKDLHVKCSTLEADLMKQKTTNQQLSHNPNYVNVNISASSKVEKGSKVEQLEMTVKACQDKILDYQEALTGKDEVIRSLEDKLFNIIEIEAQRRDKELKKMKMRCELMAQMQINSRLSEINAFLDKRAEEQSMNDQERDRISEKIQKDLSERLQQSSQELSHIKNQLKDTERGISGLQRQLESRDRQLVEERTKRKVLEKHFEKKTQQRIMNDVAKHRRQSQIGAFF